MLKIWIASPNETLIGISSRAARRVCTTARRLDEEVQQHGLATGLATSM